ncbi:hypothetical protein SteCoe_36429 [Stentor coeruleus]|uniref:Uncharacterized protein n=1 Tax=Stentor coeruleus TaxID=5963 RepID=A0A1R2AQ99_9CILI|nr:hypothetical protein SteCoe_36429 [Stentor coeruleus]
MVKQNNTQNLPLSTDPDTFARAVLGGLRRGVNHGYWKHKLLSFLLRFPPYQITIILVRLTIGSAMKKGLIS